MAKKLLLVLVAMAWSVPPALAQDSPASPVAKTPRQKSGKKPPEKFRVDALKAEYRWLTLGLTNLPLDDEGTRLGQKLWAEQRLRLMGKFRLPAKGLRLEFGFDAFTGLVAGDTTSVGAGRLLFQRRHLDAFRRFELRRGFLAWRSSVGELRLGHQVNDWGYGILANSGERELEFGDQRLGDMVERLAFVTKPFMGSGGIGKNIYTAVALDLVYRDTNANLIDGDYGMNALAVIFYRTRKTFVGFYGAYRYQRDRDNDALNVGAFNFHARFSGRSKSTGLAWGAGVEAVVIAGTSSRLRLDDRIQGVDVFAGGGVARARIEHEPSRFGFTFDIGFASGDNDRSDGTSRAFTFHPDFRAGLVLFKEVLAGMTARSSDRLADPSRVGQPPSGTENVLSYGGVTNAIYFWPRVHFRPLKDLTLRLGILYARAVADVVDPFTSFRAGGVNRNFFDGPGENRDLGWEIQAGVRYSPMLVKGLRLHVGIDWGHLFPGDAFTDAAGSTMVDVDRVVGRIMLDWRY